MATVRCRLRFVCTLFFGILDLFLGWLGRSAIVEVRPEGERPKVQRIDDVDRYPDLRSAVVIERINSARDVHDSHHGPPSFSQNNVTGDEQRRQGSEADGNG